MPILVKGNTPPATVMCVREIRVGIPRELLREIQEFYTNLISLPPWPDSRQIPGGWGLGLPRAGLLLQFRHDPDIDPVHRRFTILVDSLFELEKRLQEREWPYQRLRGFGWTDQYMLLQDPAGHLIEIRQSTTL